MKAPLIIACLLVAASVSASERHYLKRNERICDSSGAFCLNGTLSYDVNPRLLVLRGRVQTAPGPGLLRIRVSGTNRQGHLRHATLEVSVRGHSSEIVNHRMIPDAPDVSRWELAAVTFVGEE